MNYLRKRVQPTDPLIEEEECLVTKEEDMAARYNNNKQVDCIKYIITALLAALSTLIVQSLFVPNHFCAEDVSLTNTTVSTPLVASASLLGHQSFSLLETQDSCPIIEAPLNEPVPLSLAAFAPVTSNFSSNLCLPDLGGRLGNHMYKYMMSFRYAIENNLTLHLPYNEDDNLFFPVLRRFTHFNCTRHPVFIGIRNWWQQPRDIDRRINESNGNIQYTLQLGGYFQDPTHVFKPHQQALLDAFAPAQQFVNPLRLIYQTVLQHAGCGNSLVVALHLRQGDLGEPECTHCSQTDAFRLPLSWYGEWLNQTIHHNPALLIKAKKLQDKDCPVPSVSDDKYAHTLAVTVVMFVEDRSTDMKGLTRFGIRHAFPISQILKSAYGRTDCLPGIPQSYTKVFMDFWLLSQFRMMAASHSTFSLTASLLSPNINATNPELDEAFFFRPNVATLNITRFMPYDFDFQFNEFNAFRQQIIARKRALGDLPPS